MRAKPSHAAIRAERPGRLPPACDRIYNRSVSRASALYRLQRLDLAIDQARSRLAEIEAELTNHSAAERARHEAAEKEAALRQASQAARAAEDAVATQRAKVEAIEQRLYGGSVNNPKELQELQAEAEALRRHLTRLEDEALEAMMRLEQAEQEAREAQARRELSEADDAGRARNLQGERQSLLAALQQRSEEREVEAVSVRAEDLELYQTLRRGPGSLAVAEMLDGSCTACGVGLSASAVQQVRSGSVLVRCRQCGRILYAG